MRSVNAHHKLYPQHVIWRERVTKGTTGSRRQHTDEIIQIDLRRVYQSRLINKFA